MKTENWTTQADAVRLAARQRRANFPAGAEWLYSNTGYLLLGEIVKRVSGQSLREFAAAADLQAARHDAHVLPRRPHAGHPGASADGLCAAPRAAGSASRCRTSSRPATARCRRRSRTCCAGTEFLRPEGRRPRRCSNARRRWARSTSGKKLDYAAGLMMGTYRGLPTVRHGGSWAGYRADLLRFPTGEDLRRVSLQPRQRPIPARSPTGSPTSCWPSQLAPKADIVSSRLRAGCQRPADGLRAPRRLLRARRRRAPSGA